MLTHWKKIFRPLAVAFSAVFFLAAQGRAAEISWAKAEPLELTLFYPGIASWEFLKSDDHRLGSREIGKMKKSCRHCHLSENEFDLKADEIASGALKMKRSHKPFEPEPIQGLKGVLKASVRAAYDDEFIYVKVEWESKGKGWAEAGQDAGDRVSLQVNRSETSFNKYGCFISCHNSLYSMPESPSRKQVRSVPYYANLDRDDVRLFAYYAKNNWSEEKGTGGTTREAGLIDLWTAELRNKQAIMHDAWIFDDRRFDEKEDVTGSASYSNGKYSVVFKRKLRTDDRNDAQLKAGEPFAFAIAIHDEKTSRRKHFVSFSYTIGLGAAKSDIKAMKLN